MVEYYTQRASDGGLIIAVFASARGAGLANTSRPDGSCILRHWAGVTPI
jgi:2,4-dienoyl-CoA reductase-like NADH-dependent reductase (Old Yellow Enzyme family)